MNEDIREMIDKINSFKQVVNENSNVSKGIFYHNSDADIKEFSPQLRPDKSSHYLFFSKERNAFIDRQFTYTVEIGFNSDKIFNSFSHITDYGLKNAANIYLNEIKQLFKNNLNYFYDEWEKAGVDSSENVIEYFIPEGGDENNKVDLLFYFLTKWNDSWCILETDIFLNFIESKGFTGFVTMEEGGLNLALKKFEYIKILKKGKMWE